MREQPGGAAREELAVVLELSSERLLSGTDRSGGNGTELGDVEEIKDARVPNERLFWLHIMDDGELDPMVRALNEGRAKHCPVPPPSSLPFITFPDMS